MKITKIDLKGYNQFKDVTIDLTYPKGHKNEGKPLDKVCFIGQSGTGKTSLLRLIKWFVTRDRNIDENLKIPIPADNIVEMDIRLREYYIKISQSSGDLYYSQPPYRIRSTSNEFPDSFIDKLYNDIKPLLINYPADLFWGMRAKSAKNGTDDEFTTQESELKQVVDFAFEDVRKTWNYLLKDIKEHRAKELFFTKQIAEEASKPDPQLSEIEKKTGEYKKWKERNPNPLSLLAEKCLDSILYNLGLKTKTDIDMNTIRNLGFIELQTLRGETVPIDFWSTGTRQLVQTAIPLYQLKPKEAIILMDEPERSLFPDIQRGIIDIYTKLAPGCQFFFATHSPIIASAFEPWEIVELKFDKDHNFASQELYYDGERRFDNYKYHPEYLRWDSILHRLFDLEEEGNEKRLSALKELAEINVRIRKLKEKNQLDSDEGKKLKEKFNTLSQKLDWRIENGK